MKTTGKKNRKKVVVTRRLRMLKSISSTSLSLGNLSNNKHRITALLKNNKTLALALQDARCELSAKQKLLENATKNFKSIVQVRSQMLEMHSVLKSFMKNFDDTLMLLNANDIQISDLTVSFQSCSEFKSKIKKLAELVEKVPEEDSSSVEQEKDNYDKGIIKSSMPNITSGHNSSNFIPMEVTNEGVHKRKTDFQTQKDLPVQVFIQNASSINLTSTDNTVISAPSALPCENSEGVVGQTEDKQTSPSKIVSVKNRKSSETPKLDSEKDRESSETPKLVSEKNRESSGTPKLSICNIEPINKLKKSSDFKSRVSFINPSSPVENSLKKLNNDDPSSQKVRSSKIPKFLDPSNRTKIKSASLDTDNGDQKSFSPKAVNICTGSGQKFGLKTFVKNSDAEAIFSETFDNLKQKEINNGNILNVVEDSRQINRRETFVIKNLDIPENKTNSHCDRRKTFVKKSSDRIKMRKSVKDKRGTFVISDAKENYTNCEYATEISKNSVCNDTEKTSYPLHSERIFAKELSSISDKAEKIAENSKAFEENLVCSKIPCSSKVNPHQNHSEEFSSHCNETVTKTKSKSKEEELNLEKGISNDVKKNSFKHGNVKEKFVNCDSIELSNNFVASQNCGQHVMQDALNGETLDNDKFVCHTKSHKRLSFKIPFESSDSECETIPDLDLHFIEEPTIKSIPIRRKISGSRKKKVFAFNVHKRKSMQSKKSLCKFPKISTSKDVSQSDSIKKEDVTTSASEYNRENVKEIVDLNSKMCNKETRTTANCCNKQEMLQSTGEKIIHEAKTIDEENLKKQDDPLTELRSYERSENLIKNSLLCHNSPVITSDKFLNAIECESENLDSNIKDSKEEHSSINSESNERKSNMENTKVVKNRKVKRYDIPVDDIGGRKNAKRISKKQSKQKIDSNQREENESNFPLKDQDNLLTELSSYKSNENLIKNSLSCHNAPVVTSDKFLNAIECESENLDSNIKDSKEEHSSINSESNERKSNMKNTKVVKNRKVKRYDIPVDDIGEKKSAIRTSKKQSKQKIDSNLREENENNFLVKNRDQAKENKGRGVIRKKKSENSTIVVQAEVHPPPRFLCITETGVMNKENCRQPRCDKFQVSVVLNDILESTNIDMLSFSCKNKLVSNSTNIPLKIPLSDNSRNIPAGAEDNIKSKKYTAISDQGVRTSKRNRNVNYAEPSLRKKMRQ